jgi:hypothetical protein
MAEGSSKAREISPLQADNKMPDGTMYGGISPDTGQAMYATPADAPETYGFNQAKRYAATLDAYGHHDWRVPTEGELNVLFQNREAIGAFIIRLPVRLPPAGTGRPRRATTMGGGASATGARSRSTPRATRRLCAVSGEPVWPIPPVSLCETSLF